MKQVPVFRSICERGDKESGQWCGGTKKLLWPLPGLMKD